MKTMEAVELVEARTEKKAVHLEVETKVIYFWQVALVRNVQVRPVLWINHPTERRTADVRKDWTSRNLRRTQTSIGRRSRTEGTSGK